MFCLGGFWQGGVLSRGFLSGGLCPGGFCPGGFCPRTIKMNELFSPTALASQILRCQTDFISGRSSELKVSTLTFSGTIIISYSFHSPFCGHFMVASVALVNRRCGPFVLSPGKSLPPSSCLSTFISCNFRRSISLNILMKLQTC